MYVVGKVMILDEFWRFVCVVFEGEDMWDWSES